MTASRDERLPVFSPFLEGWFFIVSRKTIEKANIIATTQKRNVSTALQAILSEATVADRSGWTRVEFRERLAFGHTTRIK